MGKHHVRVYDELSAVELVGVMDADPDRAAELAAEYGVRPYGLEELLERVDLVSVATPTRFHYDNARRCIDAGVDVLIEKPFVEDPRRGRELIRAADRADVTLQVGHVERFNPAVETLGEIVPELDVLAVEARRLGPPPERRIEDTAVMDLMIHDVDVLCSLFGWDVAELEATGTADGRHATAMVAFEDGPSCTVTASRVTQRKVRELTLTARDCYVVVDFIDQSVQIHRQSVPEYVTQNGDVRYRHESLVENPAVETGEPLKRELAAFVEAARTGTEPAVTGEEALNALALVREIDQRSYDADTRTAEAHD